MEPLRGIHEYYTNTPRHWSSQSEKYTGADSLIHAIDNGWTLYRSVYRQEIILSGGRYTHVYFFELYKDGTIATMAVIDTPILLRLIVKYHLHMVETPAHGEDETVEVPAVKPSKIIKALA